MAQFASAQAARIGMLVDTQWYHASQLNARLWCIIEPRVHPIWQANMHLVLGRDADLLIDSGMGIAPLRPFVDGLRPDPAKRLICLTTHAHIDHFGAVHEFDERLVHPIDAEEMAAPPVYSLRTNSITEATRDLFRKAGYDALWPCLVDALPAPDYDIDAYVLEGAEATGCVDEGDWIDLGDWRAEILHLPGHAPGQVGLFHHDSGTLFGADAVYDGPLIYEGEGTDLDDYAKTLHKIAALPVKRVHGGHDPSFDKTRLDEMITHYLPIFETPD